MAERLVRAEDFTVASVKVLGGTWEPNYAVGMGIKWVSSWTFRPDPPAAKQQPIATQVASSIARVDAAPEKAKKPQQFLGKQQVEADAGTTIPIVFGKRENNIGGIWVQPALLKTGLANFQPSFLYAVSQGAAYPASPDLSKMWVGTKNLNYVKARSSITAWWLYSFEDTMVAAGKYKCPIYDPNSLGTPTPTVGSIYCDKDAYTYLGALFTTSGASHPHPDVINNYYKYWVITKGEGDTDNSVIRYNNSDVYVYDSNTGLDVTTGFWTYLGINPVGTFTYVNAVYSGSTIIGGNNPGTIVNSGSTYLSPLGPLPFTTGPYVILYGSGTLINQINGSLPADTGTLYGVQYVWGTSPYVNPASPPTTKDFLPFSDITFLRIDGPIYDKVLDTFTTFSPGEPEAWPTSVRQLSVYLDEGVAVDLYSEPLLPGNFYSAGSSNQFVDLAMYVFALMKRAKTFYTESIVYPAPSFVDVIDTSNMQDLAAFCSNTGLFFNGVIDQSVNAVEYISQIAPFFLLSFIAQNGQYKLLPILPVTAGNQIKTTALTAAQTFTEDDILPGSFVKSFYGPEQLRPTTISVAWNNVTPALVGKQITTVVRYSDTASSAPTVQFDMTDFCTSQAHAVVYAKYELARRKFSTHAITFTAPLLTTGLVPTQIIKVQKPRINTRGDNRIETDWYQITKITHTTTGASTIEATHFPVDGSDIAKISNEIVNGSFVVV